MFGTSLILRHFLRYTLIQAVPVVYVRVCSGDKRDKEQGNQITEIVLKILNPTEIALKNALSARNILGL